MHIFTTFETLLTYTLCGYWKQGFRQEDAKNMKKKKRDLFSPIVQPEPTQPHGNTATSYPPPSLPQPSSKWSLPAASQVILLKSMLTITLLCLKYLRDSSVKFKMAWHY